MNTKDSRDQNAVSFQSRNQREVPTPQSPVESAFNVYRDDLFMVAPLVDAVFPNRCVKTNAPVDAADFECKLKLGRDAIDIPHTGGEDTLQVLTRALFGSVGHNALKALNQWNLEYSIGLSTTTCASMRKKRVLGALMIPTGLAVGAGLGIAAFMFIKDKRGEFSLPWVLAGAVVGLVICLSGIWMTAEGSETLQAVRSDGKLVWLKGACPEYLASLPESPVKWERGWRKNKAKN